jgi:hypothetical protein
MQASRMLKVVASSAASLLLLGPAAASNAVTVTNDPAHAVPVAVQGTATVKLSGDPAAAAAVQAQGTCPQQCSADGFADVTLFTVPPGKRLVIEHVSGLVTLATGAQAAYTLKTAVSGSFGGNLVDHVLAPAPAAGGQFTISNSLRVYADQGSSVIFHVDVTTAGGNVEYVLASISGYLVDL